MNEMEVFTCADCKRKASLGVHLPDENKSLCIDCAKELVKKIEGKK